jgi:hypothetical protein
MRKGPKDLPLSENGPEEAPHDRLDRAIRTAVDTKLGSPHSAAAASAPPLDRNDASARIRSASPRRVGDDPKSAAPLRPSLDPVRVPEPADHLAHAKGAIPFSDHALAVVPNLDAARLKGVRNQFWNAFKHATTHKGVARDDTSLFKGFNDLQNDHMLFVGWYDYAMAAKALPMEAQVFQIWYFALYPEKLDPKHDWTPYTKTFPRLKRLSRLRQKQALRDVIARTRHNRGVMRDHRTERAPLIAPR